MTEIEVTAKELLNPNRALMEEARELLESDEKFCAALERWVPRQCENIKGYSEQNQAMMLLQCMRRGLGPRKFTFQQVQLFDGWLNQGRAVRKGEKGFVISAIVTHANPKDDNGEPERDADGNVKKGSVKGFRWMTVFDISQTDPMTEEQILARRKRREAPPKAKGKGRKR